MLNISQYMLLEFLGGTDGRQSEETRSSLINTCATLLAWHEEKN
jgi:hypothetical protein